MTSPIPEHGERACYLRGCRRSECRDAAYRYMSRYRLDRHYGQRRRINATPAADHVQRLLAAGWNKAQIAKASNCSDCAIRSIASRLYTTTRADMATRILNLPITPPPAPTRYADATGTIRRIRALIAIGHQINEIANATGINKTPISKIANTSPLRVETTTAVAVATLYRRWAHTPGTSTRSRLHAARHGWHGPLAWDDIDNPDEQPDIDNAQPTEDRRADAAIAAAEVQHLAAFGTSTHEIAARVGRSESYIRSQLRGERGPGWRNQLEEAA